MSRGQVPSARFLPRVLTPGTGGIYGAPHLLPSEAGIGALGTNCPWGFGQIASHLGASVSSASALPWLPSRRPCLTVAPKAWQGPPPSLAPVPHAGHTPIFCHSKFILSTGCPLPLTGLPTSTPSSYNRLLLGLLLTHPCPGKGLLPDAHRPAPHALPRTPCTAPATS